MNAGPLAAAGCVALLSCLRGTRGAYVWNQSYMEGDFFSKWSFWTAPDPTGGAVTYVDYETAKDFGLVAAWRDRVYIGADMVTKVENATRTDGRRSVRIQSTAMYNGGLFVATFEHIPTGCGTWPAFWLYGEDARHIWPTWGEYDIIEGAHTMTHTRTSLHSTALCNQSGVDAGKDFTGEWVTGPLGVAADSCDINTPDQFYNQGCSQLGPNNSIGEAFNAGGGGTYAAEWDPQAQHIRTWFWPKGSEPLSLVERRPEPDSWGMPYSYFTLVPSECSAVHFINMRLVFDLTFCGAIGEPTYAMQCPRFQQRMTCRELVLGHPGEMKEAYWSIRTLDVYQQQGGAHLLVPVQHGPPIPPPPAGYRSPPRIRVTTAAPTAAPAEMTAGAATEHREAHRGNATSHEPRKRKGLTIAEHKKKSTIARSQSVPSRRPVQNLSRGRNRSAAVAAPKRGRAVGEEAAGEKPWDWQEIAGGLMMASLPLISLAFGILLWRKAHRQEFCYWFFERLEDEHQKFLVVDGADHLKLQPPEEHFEHRDPGDQGVVVNVPLQLPGPDDAAAEGRPLPAPTTWNKQAPPENAKPQTRNLSLKEQHECKGRAGNLLDWGIAGQLLSSRSSSPTPSSSPRRLWDRLAWPHRYFKDDQDGAVRHAESGSSKSSVCEEALSPADFAAHQQPDGEHHP